MVGRFTLVEKYEILAEYDATEHGARGLVLRKWDVSSDTLRSWKRRRRLALERVDEAVRGKPSESELLAAYELLQEQKKITAKLKEELEQARKQVKAARRKARRSEVKAQAAFEVADELGKLSELLTQMASTQSKDKSS